MKKYREVHKNPTSPVAPEHIPEEVGQDAPIIEEVFEQHAPIPQAAFDAVHSPDEVEGYVGVKPPPYHDLHVHNDVTPLRDLIAIAALNGFITRTSINDLSVLPKSGWAKVAYEFADAMLRARQP